MVEENEYCSSVIKRHYVDNDVKVKDIVILLEKREALSVEVAVSISNFTKFLSYFTT